MKKFYIMIFALILAFTLNANPSFAGSAATANSQTNSNSASDSNANIGDVGAQSSIDRAGTFENSFNSSNARGGFLIPPDVQFGPVINYFGKPNPSDGFQPVESLLMYHTWFTRGSLESIKKGDWDAEAEFFVANEMLKAPGLYSTDGKVQWIKIVVSKQPVQNAQEVGYVTARSTDSKVGMPQVMAAAALEAMDHGCNVIHFIAQGAVRDAFSKGWGIGFNTSYGKIAGGSDNDESYVGGGGLGYSSAKAGMRDKPWLQGHGLWLTGLTAPEFTKPVAEVQTKMESKNEIPAAPTAKGNTMKTEVKVVDPVVWGTVNGKSYNKVQ